MNAVKNVQYLIHKHYDLIKLALLTILIVLAVITLLNLQSSEARRAESDARVNKELIQLANDIARSQQKQHDHQDERQACFFNLFVSYTNHTPRIPITQEDTDRCRVGGTDAPNVYTKQSQESTDSQNPPSGTTQSVPAQPSPAPSDTTTTNQPTTSAGNGTPPKPGIVQQVWNVVRGVF